MRPRAEQLEGALLDLARQHADVDALEVGRHADRADAVGDVAEAVLVPAEDAEVALALDRLHEAPAERAVHRAARVVVVAEQERQIDEAQFRARGR